MPLLEEFIRKHQRNFKWWLYWQDNRVVKPVGDRKILLRPAPFTSPSSIFKHLTGEPELEEYAPIVPVTRWEADQLKDLFVEPEKGYGREAIGRLAILPIEKETGLEGYFLYDLPLKKPLYYDDLHLQTISTPAKKTISLFNKIRKDRSNRIFQKRKSIEEGLSDFLLQADRYRLIKLYKQACKGGEQL